MDENIDNDITDEYDKEFINLLMEIEKQTEKLKKHDQLRVKSWCKKLCQVTNNVEWKKNRNLHAICLLDSVLNERFEDPYNRFAPEGTVPIINKTIVKSKLSPKFLKSAVSQPINSQLQPKKADAPPKNNNPLPKKSSAQKMQKKNIQLPKEREFNITMGKNFVETEPIVYEKGNEEELKKIIDKLQDENRNKDNLINQLKNDKLKMEKRIQELEKMLSGFVEMDK